MAKCRPSKWVPWAFLGAGLPLLAAAVYEASTHKMTDSIAGQAASALSSDESTAWAKVESTRRDFVLQGTAPSQEAVDKAVAAVAGTYGVRTVVQNIQIVEPLKLTAPTVESVTSAEATPTLKGTWQEGVAKTLVVGLAGTAYKLGENPELTTLAGEWTLKPAALAEGSYDVTVETSDGKTTLAASAPGKLVIDLPEPVAPVVVVEPIKLALPTVVPFIGNIATPTFTGTWPEVDAKTVQSNLQVKLGEDMFVLGKNPELKSDGAGNWTLSLTKPLAEGEFDIMPGVVGTDGKWLKAEAAAKAVIDLTPPPAPEITPTAAGAIWPFAITGKWAEAAGAGLIASVAGHKYTVNSGAALSSDGKGNFTFAPAAKFAPGSYDVDFAVNDAAGNVTTQTLKAAIVIPEPVAPPPPVMAPLETVISAAPAGAVWPYAVTGTWDEKPTNTLTASVLGRSYVLGRGAALTSDGAGKFSFAPSAKFAPGSYDVDFITTNSAGEVKVTAKAAIVVPEPVAPVAVEVIEPVVPATKAVVDAVAATTVWPYAVTGTWDEKPGHSLSAAVNGRTYILGRGAALTSDGAGKFSFAPAARFAPGSYDVVFTTNDATSESKVTVAQAAIIVPEPVAPPAPPPAPKMQLPAPTVISQLDLTGAPIIKGTWPNDKATGLAVTVAGRTYKMGTDANLGVRDGNWSLLPGAALQDGVYDVVAEASANDAVSSTDATTNELEVDVTQPMAPTVMTVAGNDSPDHLSGTWDNKIATGLKITVPQVNLTAELGAANSPLVDAGDGKWRLNLAAPLPVGTYNVVAETTDKRGRIQTDASEGEVVVAAKNVVVRSIAPYDCVAVMRRIGSVFPIRFEYDLTSIVKPYDLSVSQYAALLKDPRCMSINIEVDGHADFKGSEGYNYGLSERRADIIVKLLTDAGVDAGRMSIKGYGETQPLDAAVTDEARSINRRVEIMAKP
jgi:outer membrane protein OmpA-like peptidoglycan-associated protein